MDQKNFNLLLEIKGPWEVLNTKTPPQHAQPGLDHEEQASLRRNKEES